MGAAASGLSRLWVPEVLAAAMAATAHSRPSVREDPAVGAAASDLSHLLAPEGPAAAAAAWVL